MAIAAPINLKNWIDENRHLLKPPVGNQQVYKLNDDFIVMVVGGPNSRKDFHFEDGEELFYHQEGDVQVKIINFDGKPETVDIKEGEMFLLPARTPHSPMRPAGTIGLVIECKRKQGEQDGLLWYCDSCNTKLHENYFPLTNIEKDFFPRFKEYYGSETLRTCKNCGKVMETDVRFVD